MGGSSKNVISFEKYFPTISYGRTLLTCINLYKLIHWSLTDAPKYFEPSILICVQLEILINILSCLLSAGKWKSSIFINNLTPVTTQQIPEFEYIKLFTQVEWLMVLN